MNRNEVKKYLTEQAKKRMELLGIEGTVPGNDTDLVKEGIFDSLSFVDLIAGCEDRFGVLIDLEKYEQGEFTRLGNLVELILESSPAA